MGRIVPSGGDVTSEHVPLTERAKRALALAMREARQWGQKYIATEHILLGLAREKELEEQATGRFLGFTGLAPVAFEAPFAPATEVGWRLRRDAWGHGFATEAAQAALSPWPVTASPGWPASSVRACWPRRAGRGRLGTFFLRPRRAACPSAPPRAPRTRSLRGIRRGLRGSPRGQHRPPCRARSPSSDPPERVRARLAARGSPRQARRGAGRPLPRRRSSHSSPDSESTTANESGGAERRAIRPAGNSPSHGWAPPPLVVRRGVRRTPSDSQLLGSADGSGVISFWRA